MHFPRSSGILLHITSLPSRFGIGDLGPAALGFVDFLEKSGQSVWQILPLSPPATGNSPYSCYSALGGNALLISPQQLVQDGWLSESDLMDPVSSPSTAAKVDYLAVANSKQTLFEKAYAKARLSLPSSDQFNSFCRQNAAWLDDFARFEAFMRHFDSSDWTRWPTDLVQRNEDALARWDDRLSDEIRFSKFLQFVFDQQWKSVKRYANERGIRIYGDMPIFVSHQSVDVWANQKLFCLNDAGKPTFVAGVPPDYFCESGQLWGNPLYRWDVLESTDFAWWTARFGHALQQFDLLRVDHFRGFESYWEIPAGAPTAVSGRWQQGPGEKPFDAARKSLGELPIIAEDLGMITQQVHDLRDRLGFPAMRVLQFGFADKDDDFHRPNRYSEHTVAYTGTHDNDTLMGWYLDRKKQRPNCDLLDTYVNGSTEIHLQLIQAVLDSASHTAIVPLQDVLGLDNSARMNVPGQPDGNWEWRARSGDLTDDLARRIHEMTKRANR